MSVRRLAADAVQPTGFSFSEENQGWAEKTIRKYPEGRQQSAVIPLLMRAQEQEGWVTRAAIEHVADRLAMPLIRVLEVATFYTQFQLAPVGKRAHIQVCGTTPCMLRGADDLKAVCRKRIHSEQLHVNEAGTLSWEEVECLGACVNAPMVMVFKDTYEDLTAERLEEIIDALEAGEPLKPGPQVDRHLSVPVGGLTTLNTFADDEEIGERSDGPAEGSPPQGEGGGAAATVAPSEAGRVDTHAEETDPTLRTPATDKGVAADQRAEDAASADPDAGAVPGAGRRGGTKAGPTDAHRKEADAESAAKGDGDGGKLPVREGAAEEAVVPDKNRPNGGEGGQVDARRPKGLHAKPPSKSDDLKRIGGVGPVLATRLNELGVYKFAQIAGWSEAELAWVDAQLELRGRAVRDRWVEQARSLAGTKSE